MRRRARARVRPPAQLRRQGNRRARPRERGLRPLEAQEAHAQRREREGDDDLQQHHAPGGTQRAELAQQADHGAIESRGTPRLFRFDQAVGGELGDELRHIVAQGRFVDLVDLQQGLDGGLGIA